MELTGAGGRHRSLRARRLLRVCVFLVAAFAASSVRAQDAGVPTSDTVAVSFSSSDTQYASLSAYDCVHSSPFDFQFVYPYVSGQEAEFMLSLSSDCSTPAGLSFQNTSSSCTDNSSCPSIILDQANGALAAPSDGETTDFSGLGLPNAITTGGVWGFYATQMSNMNGANAYEPNNTTQCGPAGGVSNVNVYVCVVFNENTTISMTPYGALGIVLNSAPPSAPAEPSVTPLDSGLQVSWSAVTGAAFYIVSVYEGQPPDAGTDAGGTTDAGMGALVKSSQVGDVTSTTIFGLTDGVTYTVYVTALDGAGTNPPTTSNSSGLSPAATGTPIASNSFFQEYKSDGGPENGESCASEGATPSLVMLAGVAFWLLRRRGRSLRRTTLLVAFAAATASLPARADPPLGTDASGWSTGGPSSSGSSPSREAAPGEDQRTLREQSPEWFRLEAMVGIFNPNPDQGIAKAPFAAVFPVKNQFLYRAQLHVNVYSGFGHLSLGLGAGVWQTAGHSLLPNGSPSGDTETFTLYPFTPMLGYRADFIYRKWNIPVVPFVKAGYGIVWWADAKNGAILHGWSDGKEWHSEGFATGLEWAGGIEFPFEFLDAQGGAGMDSQFGINSIGIYGEYGWSYWRGTNGGLPLGGWAASLGLYVAF